ncbi:MAG: YqgE/AlgH family protein [Myxococcales bacterium]|nr:YqgE/AlgH family protein [Myxococcales bacterium]MDH5305615.1 YqgE/AlgH family protein [Myxococcales bacterium]MDH5565713.1 YqgE/AlgH family protein [Myxococcales bacterium]
MVRRYRHPARDSPATLGAVSDASIAPALLVAMPQLLDPNFQRAVVLLVHHDPGGTFGIVLNRSTEITTQNLCESIDIDWHGDPDSEIYWGGPVQPQTGWVLFEEGAAPEASEDVRQVAEGIRFAGSLDVLRRMANHPPGHLRVLLGYAGWGPGQLEAELAQGAWLLAPVESRVVFEVEPEAMWTHVVRSLGIEPATLVASRGIH